MDLPSANTSYQMFICFKSNRINRVGHLFNVHIYLAGQYMPCFNEGPSNTTGLIKGNHFTVF